MERQEKRRGERVLIRVPVQVHGVAPDGSEVKEAAETAMVSRFGALLRMRSLLKKESSVTVKNTFSEQVEKFRVVWIADKQTAGCWDIGIEAPGLPEDFWGILFPARERKA